MTNPDSYHCKSCGAPLQVGQLKCDFCWTGQVWDGVSSEHYESIFVDMYPSGDNVIALLKNGAKVKIPREAIEDGNIKMIDTVLAKALKQQAAIIDRDISHGL